VKQRLLLTTLGYLEFQLQWNKRLKLKLQPQAA
jgi:hypothetical protein